MLYGQPAGICQPRASQADCVFSAVTRAELLQIQKETNIKWRKHGKKMYKNDDKKESENINSLKEW